MSDLVENQRNKTQSIKAFMAQTALTKLLDTFLQAAQTEREKGTYFEELVKT